LNGEKLEEFNRIPKVPKFVKKMIVFIMRLKGRKQQAEILDSIGNTDTYHYLKKIAEINIDKSILKEWFESNEIDAIIQPGMPCPAVL